MERTIINPIDSGDSITTFEITNLDDGVIIIYDGSKVIGSVVYLERNAEFTIETVNDRRQFDTLKDLMDSFPYYTYKYLT
jgi:hypothetical protein